MKEITEASASVGLLLATAVQYSILLLNDCFFLVLIDDFKVFTERTTMFGKKVKQILPLCSCSCLVPFAADKYTYFSALVAV